MSKYVKLLLTAVTVWGTTAFQIHSNVHWPSTHTAVTWSWPLH